MSFIKKKKKQTNEEEFNYYKNYDTNFYNEEVPLNKEEHLDEKKIIPKTSKIVNKNDITIKHKDFKEIIYKSILIILLIIGIFHFVYHFITSQNETYNIKCNLTSFGLLKSNQNTSSYQINYLIKPSTSKIPKLTPAVKDIININETTAYLTSKNIGETDIYISNFSKNNSKTSAFKVFVVPEPVLIIDFLAEDITVKVNERDMIVITPVPLNTTDINFTYKSSDPLIANVINNGIIEGLKKGNTQITITNNNIIKTINVTVN